MDDLVKTLDSMIEPEMTNSATQLKTIIGKLFVGLQEQKSDTREGCVSDSKITSHRHQKKIFLGATANNEFPEVLSFNLNWLDRNPDPFAVLKSLVSIPELMNVSDVFSARDDQQYVLRGMICFGHNHYFAFFRKIFFKACYLNGLDYKNLERQT